MLGQIVQDARVRAGLSQSGLERQIGKSRGYVARLEGEAIFPPRSVCEDLAGVLDLDAEDLWSATVEDRLRADPDVWAWHEQRLRQAGGVSLSTNEQRLVEALRSTRESLASDELADRLAYLLESATGSIDVWLDPWELRTLQDVLKRHHELGGAAVIERLSTMETSARGQLVRLVELLAAVPAAERPQVIRQGIQAAMERASRR